MPIEPTQVILLMMLAMVTALVTRRLALPYTVGLVIVGACLALFPVKGAAPLTRDFIFDVILPPLLFEAALNLHWSALRRDLALILTLAIVGTLIAALLVAGAMSVLLGWPLPSALVFGALIAATDPVSVIALFKDLGVKGRIRTLVESESLFNDVAAAILFSLALGFASGGAASTPFALGGHLFIVVAGGALIGAACGGVALVMIGRTSDHLIEAALTTLAGYGAFFGAETLGVSGILATVVAGLIMGNIGLLRASDANAASVSERGRDFILSFWEFVAFLSNSAIFPLIGLSVARIPLDAGAAASLAATILIVLGARAIAVYPLSALFSWSKQAVSLKEQHVLWWGGLRGALGLALALSLPPDFRHHDQITIATFAVAIFSIVAQGLTMPLLIRKLALGGDGAP